jgi:hypothetical protein
MAAEHRERVVTPAGRDGVEQVIRRRALTVTHRV